MIDPNLLPFLISGLALGFVAGLWLMALVLERITGKRWH